MSQQYKHEDGADAVGRLEEAQPPSADVKDFLAWFILGRFRVTGTDPDRRPRGVAERIT